MYTVQYVQNNAICSSHVSSNWYGCRLQQKTMKLNQFVKYRV